MVERTGDNDAQPLPREWLPDAAAPADAPEWDATLQRILAAAEPALRRLESGDSQRDVTWVTVLGSWWKPAAAIVAAAALLLLLDRPNTAIGESQRGSLPLNVMAAEGEPVALWESVGIDAHPVLALIALQQQGR